MKIISFLLIFSVYGLNPRGCSFNRADSVSLIDNVKPNLKRYRRLKHFIDLTSEKDKINAYLLIPSSGLGGKVEKLKISFPAQIKDLIDNKDIELCPYDESQKISKSLCSSKISFLTKSNKRDDFIKLVPKKPFFKGKDYAIKISIDNKYKPGLYQINLFIYNTRNKDNIYLGSWRLDIRRN